MNSGDSPILDVELTADLLENIVKPPVKIAVDGLANLRWHEEGLHISSVDASNAIVVEQRIPASVFNKYEVNPIEDEIVFGTSCETVSNLLKSANSGDVVSLNLDTKTNRLDISFSDVNYSLAGVSPDAVDEGEVPELDYAIQAKIHSRVFQRAQYVVGMVTESVTFEVSSQNLTVSGRGDSDTAEIDVEIVETKEAIDELEKNVAATIDRCESPVKSRYSTEYIRYINDFTPSGLMEIRLSEDYPLYINIQRANGRIDSEIIIAPRMDNSSN